MPPKQKRRGGGGNFQVPLLGAGLLLGLVGGGVGAQYLLKKNQVPPLVAPAPAAVARMASKGAAAPAPVADDAKAAIDDLKAQLQGQKEAAVEALKKEKQRKRLEHENAFEQRKAVEARKAQLEEAVKKRGRFEPVVKAQERFAKDVHIKELSAELADAVQKNAQNEAEKKEMFRVLNMVKAVIGGKINLLNADHKRVVEALEAQRDLYAAELAAYQEEIPRIGERALQEIEVVQFDAEAREQKLLGAQKDVFEQTIAKLRIKLDEYEEQERDLYARNQDLEAELQENDEQMGALLARVQFNAGDKAALEAELQRRRDNSAKAKRVARALKKLA